MLSTLVEKAALLLSLCVTLVYAVPAFEGVSAWSSIGNLVPGMTLLEAVGPEGAGRDAASIPQYLSILAPRGMLPRRIKPKESLT